MGLETRLVVVVRSHQRDYSHSNLSQKQLEDGDALGKPESSFKGFSSIYCFRPGLQE